MFSSEALRPGTAISGRKALGKLAARLEEVKNPWKQSSTLELSHNESARLATDALLESGEEEYQRVLAEERELPFLSPLEIEYITRHGNKKNGPSPSPASGVDRDGPMEGDALSELTSGTYFPMMSDEEPPLLELGWPNMQLSRGAMSETRIYFQRDKSQNLKDIIRSLINKAKQVIALLMDLFTDVDLFCDLLEAANKRRVAVYILLDEKNLPYFLEMCNNLNIRHSDLQNMRIRSICGETYCTKYGKKFTGQVLEKFLIIDGEEVITGSYSFTWLSAQVHTNMMIHLTGSIVESFDREFRCIYADSQVISGLHDPNDDDDDDAVVNVQIPRPNGIFNFDYKLEGPKQNVRSDPSSSLSSNSLSSIKKSPGAISPTSKANHDKKEGNNGLSNVDKGGSSPTTFHFPSQILRGSGTGGPSVVPLNEWSNARNGPSVVPFTEWSNSRNGLVQKSTGLGLFETRQNFNSNHNTYLEHEPNSKQRPTVLLSKMTDLLTLPTKNKEVPPPNMPVRSPPRNGFPAFKDIKWSDTENRPGIPDGPLPSETQPQERMNKINRHDEKRMTLGHSKLELVNQYNKTKKIYSRFEMK
ncbi:protein FAM83C [Polypterus senegalus]|uniref:protein FAM83C n=1 Tax=Polypterus senegalus TaxID=55291 RepID=UPI001964A522|nr:protein FAM83C [Polypterus senegalus]